MKKELRDWVENIQQDIEKGYYDKAGGVAELEKLCKAKGLDVYEDVILPIEYNTCEHCGAVQYSEYLCWIDSLDDYTKEDVKVLKTIADMGEDYCAICDRCYTKLKNMELKK